MYVEVIYLENGHYKGRKWAEYPEHKADLMYVKTVAKMEQDKVSSLICLRTEDHGLIKSHRVK